MAKDKEKTSYLPVKAQQAQIRLSEGRKELKESLEYMNQIKTSVAKWQNDTKDFFDEVKDVYESKKEEIEKASTLPVISTIKAAWETFPALFRREDPTKKRFGKVLNSLVRDAEHIYKSFGEEVDNYQERFEEMDGLTGDLLREAKVYRQGIAEYNTQKKEAEKRLSDLETKLTGIANNDPVYLDLKEKMLEAKREVEAVRTERSSALNKYQQTMNIYDALDTFRDENGMLLEESKKLHETLETNINSLRPLFEHITAAADLVDFQAKALNTYEMLKLTFNSSMIAITAVAKSVSKVAAEKQGELFITNDTKEAVKQLVDKHKQELGERDKREDEVIEDLLHGKKEKDDSIEMKEGEDYQVIFEKKQELTENE